MRILIEFLVIVIGIPASITAFFYLLMCAMFWSFDIDPAAIIALRIFFCFIATAALIVFCSLVSGRCGYHG